MRSLLGRCGLISQRLCTEGTLRLSRASAVYNHIHAPKGRVYSTANDDLSRRATKLLSPRDRPHYNLKPKLIPPDENVEEENIPGFDITEWANIAPGDIFNDRYQALAKIGWGSVSTVWLAKDLNKREGSDHPGYYTLKISKTGEFDRQETVHEMAVMQRLHDADPKHKGLRYLRTYEDYFEIEIPGQSGSHVVLVQEPMRETLGQFRRRFKGNALPPKILQGFMQYWLSALDYMHTKAHVVHTDIKDDNILMTFESTDILSEFDKNLADDPPVYKPLPHNRRLYQSHTSFGKLKSFAVEPRLVDFGASHRMDGTPYKLFPIQPRYYRAPEVILGSGWSYPADIWNLGALAFTLLQDHHLFRRVNTTEGTYDVKSHLAQMYKLLDPPPPHLLKRIQGNAKQKFEPAMINDDGQECDTPLDYFGGPFFGEDGEFLLKEFVPEDRDFNWEGKVSALEGEDKELFLGFVKKCLRWDPEERATAGELLEDPWVVQYNKVV